LRDCSTNPGSESSIAAAIVHETALHCGHHEAIAQGEVADAQRRE